PAFDLSNPPVVPPIAFREDCGRDCVSEHVAVITAAFDDVPPAAKPAAPGPEHLHEEEVRGTARDQLAAMPDIDFNQPAVAIERLRVRDRQALSGLHSHSLTQRMLLPSGWKHSTLAAASWVPQF